MLHPSPERSLYLQEDQGSLLLLLQLSPNWKEVLSLQPLQGMLCLGGPRKKATTAFKANLPERDQPKSRANKTEDLATIATRNILDGTLNDEKEITETLPVRDPGDGDSRVPTNLIKEFAEISQEGRSQERLGATLPWLNTGPINHVTPRKQKGDDPKEGN